LTVVIAYTCMVVVVVVAVQEFSKGLSRIDCRNVTCFRFSDRISDNIVPILDNHFQNS
jgi:hypothetical protein